MTVSTKQQQIAYRARRFPGEPLVSLNHFLDKEWLGEAYRRTRKDGAVGVDGVTAADYASRLEENLDSLVDRARSGTYKAPPVKRGYVPKAGGKERRAIGMPSFEDKVLQRGVSMVLEPIYEEQFLDCSYGFRPKRSAHQALESLWQQIRGMGGCWVVDVDIRKFFDTLDFEHLREILNRRVQDGVIRRLIDKWLKAGVFELGQVTHPNQGTPQGGCVSPILSNIYLHAVLDEWFETEIKPRLKGKAFMVRFADDFVMGFTEEPDARRVLDVLSKRFGKYGLTVHPEKTRLVDFRAPWRILDGSPGTFDFLGFTHYWGKSRKGADVAKRKTAKDRMSRSIKNLESWCKRNRHLPLKVQHRKLNQKLRGHYAYFGITGNYGALWRMYEQARRNWCKWLKRRTRGRKGMTWERYEALTKGVFKLAQPRIVHSVM